MSHTHTHTHHTTIHTHTHTHTHHTTIYSLRGFFEGGIRRNDIHMKMQSTQ